MVRQWKGMQSFSKESGLCKTETLCCKQTSVPFNPSTEMAETGISGLWVGQKYLIPQHEQTLLSAVNGT